MFLPLLLVRNLVKNIALPAVIASKPVQIDSVSGPIMKDRRLLMGADYNMKQSEGKRRQGLRTMPES